MMHKSKIKEILPELKLNSELKTDVATSSQTIAKPNVMRSLPIAEILGEDQPWPIIDVLKKLIEASEILLINKSYDGHGWEEIHHAVEVAKQKVRLLSGNAV